VTVASADFVAFMERPQSRPGVAPPDLEPHPLASLIPEMGDDEYAALVDDIRTRGLMEPVVLYEGKILDGRHRYRACQEAGRAADCTEYVGDDPAGYVVALNVHRRHLDREQRRHVIAELLKQAPETSDRRVAATVGVSPTTVGKVRAELVEQGDVSELDTRIDTTGRRQPATRPEADANVEAVVAEIFGVPVETYRTAKLVGDADPALLDEVDAGIVSLSEAAERVAQSGRPRRRPVTDDIAKAVTALNTDVGRLTRLVQDPRFRANRDQIRARYRGDLDRLGRTLLHVAETLDGAG